MAIHKILLDDDFAEDFSLIAIHCSEEAYKVAFLLNQYLDLSLKRKSTDLHFSADKLEVSFPIFEYENKFQYTYYYLVGNTCKSRMLSKPGDGELFGEAGSEKIITTHLLPEFNRADYFLKIESDFQSLPLRKNIARLNEIKQIISAYEVDTSQIKSNNNLIFS